MPVEHRIEVVTFDADFTLVRHHDDRWPLQTLALAGYRGWERQHLQRASAIAAATMPSASVMWMSDAAVRAGLTDYCGAYLKALGLSATPQLVGQIVNDRLSPDSWRPYKEVHSTLTALSRRGVQLGVVAHWASDIDELLHGARIRPFFDFVLSSAAVGTTKVDGALYHMAVKAAGVPARLLLHVGDDAGLDVAAARTAGLQALWLNRRGWRGIRDLRHVLKVVEANY